MGVGAVLEAVHLQHLCAVHVERAPVVGDLGADVAPGVQVDAVHGSLVVRDAELPEVGERIARVGEVLAAVGPAHGVIAARAVGGADVEALEFAVVLAGAEHDADEAPGVVGRVRQQPSAHVHIDGAVVEINAADLQIGVLVRQLLVDLADANRAVRQVLRAGVHGGRVCL